MSDRIDADILDRIATTLGWKDLAYPTIAAHVWRTACCQRATLREEPERHCPACGKVATWSRTKGDGVEYLYPVQVVESTPVMTMTDYGGWVRCGHCRWTELLLTARWQMASQWPGLVCPQCRIGWMRPATKPERG